jgi:hypothetical protein
MLMRARSQDSSIYYGIEDDQGGEAEGLLTITITGENDPPEARDDEGRTPENP